MAFPKVEHYFGVSCDQGEHPKVRVVVCHETQGTTFSGALNTLKTRSDGSAHLLIGYDSGTMKAGRLATDSRILCHTGGQNYGSVGVEKCGLSAWKNAFRIAWKDERKLIAATAWLMARELKKHDLPPRYLSIKKLSRTDDLSDSKGWCYHRDCSYAFRTTTHTDPGIPGLTWPHRRFKQYVRYYWHHRDRDEYVSYRKVKKWARRSKKRH